MFWQEARDKAFFHSAWKAAKKISHCRGLDELWELRNSSEKTHLGLLSTKAGVQPQEKRLSVREVGAVQVLVQTGLVSSSSLNTSPCPGTPGAGKEQPLLCPCPSVIDLLL